MSTNTSTRVAVITGGAAGFGQAFAERLARDGHDIAVLDVADTEETAVKVHTAGREFLAVRCDVSSAAAVAAAAAQVRERLGSADVLVHNAGIYPLATLEDTDWETWRRIMSINLDSCFHVFKAFLPGMRERGWGRIIAMAATTFHAGGAGLSAYTASKGGVIGLVRSIAGEVADAGITANCVAPSLTRTPGTSTGRHDDLGLFDMLSRQQAIHRTQVPGDLVGAVSFVASDDAAFMTGQTLVVDGGWARV